MGPLHREEAILSVCVCVCVCVCAHACVCVCVCVCVCEGVEGIGILMWCIIEI